MEGANDTAKDGARGGAQDGGQDGGQRHDPADPVQATSVWQRMERTTRTPRTTLSHAAIAAAAVEIADAEGLDAVSMRKLSGHLGVTTMALYRYVTGKEELFELMADAAYPDSEPAAGEGATWRDVLRSHAHQLRAIALRHPWMIELSARRVVHISPRVMATLERSLAALDGLDLDYDDMFAVQYAVLSYVRGAIADEVGQLELMKRQQWESGHDLRLAYGPHMKWLLETGRYPVFTRWAMTAERKDDADWRFEFGLDCVLDGVAARLGI